MIDRRGFLGSLIGGVATASAVRTWPFRVFSFPSTIVVSPTIRLEFEYFWASAEALHNAGWNTVMADDFVLKGREINKGLFLIKCPKEEWRKIGGFEGVWRSNEH